MPTRPWKDIRNSQKRISKKELAEIQAKARAQARTFRALREELGFTQAQLAELSGMTQSEISRFEQRDDFYLSTLRTMLEALGGELEITAVMPDGRRVTVRTPSEAPAK